jgi:hypothetical protein
MQEARSGVEKEYQSKFESYWTAYKSVQDFSVDDVTTKNVISRLKALSNEMQGARIKLKNNIASENSDDLKSKGLKDYQIKEIIERRFALSIKDLEEEVKSKHR